MGILQINRSILACDGDGCDATFGAPGGYVSPSDARGAAYGAGWRFPHHVSKKGATSSTTSDVCPKCVPGWVPQQRSARSRVLRQHEASDGGED